MTGGCIQSPESFIAREASARASPTTMLTVLWSGLALGLVPSTHWSRFADLHAGEWRGRWSTLGPDGTLLDEISAGQRLEVAANEDVATNTLIFVSQSVRSDCETCFDSEETKEMPAGRFSADTLPYYVCGQGSAFGPRVLRSGAMSFEACVRHGDERVRLTAQFAPEPSADGSAAPVSLALGRVTVACEALAPAAAALTPVTCDVPLDWDGTWAGTRHTLVAPPSPAADAAVEAVTGVSLAQEGEATPLALPSRGVAAVLPARILAAQPTPLTLSWQPSAGTALRLEASVEALGRSVASTETETVMSPCLGSGLTLTLTLTLTLVLTRSCRRRAYSSSR